MGFVAPSVATVGTDLQVLLRGKPVNLTVAALPMVPQHYYRGP